MLNWFKKLISYLMFWRRRTIYLVNASYFKKGMPIDIVDGKGEVVNGESLIIKKVVNDTTFKVSRVK